MAYAALRKAAGKPVEVVSADHQNKTDIGGVALDRPQATTTGLTALAWLVHPLLSETVEYVTQRTESMMGLAYLVTLYCAVR